MSITPRVILSRKRERKERKERGEAAALQRAGASTSSAQPPRDGTNSTEPSRASCRDRLLTPKEAAEFLRCSTSWMAKARMRGDGPPFVKLGGCVRYLESTLVRWMKAQQRLSISGR